MNAVTYSPAQVIERYLMLRERKKAIDAEYKAKLAELEAMMDSMERYLLLTMEDRGEVQIKTDFGTAYRAPQMRCTMVDRQALINHTLDRVVEIGTSECDTEEELHAKASPLFDIFTNHVNKEAVKAMLDANVQPIGVDVVRFVECNVRKA